MSAPSLDSPPRLGDRFEWIRHLGRGGHGRVELVRDRASGAVVALKLLPPSRSRVADLKREFRLLRDLAHPNLVAMLELVIEPELECLVLEHVDGVDLLAHLDPSFERGSGTATRTLAGTLAQTVGAAVDGAGAAEIVAPAASARPAPERLATPFLQLVSALSFLEARGLVHADLKPENVLVAGARAVVLDFGIARLHGEAPRPIGTLPYMAPEQLEGRPLGAATDRYALGVLLYRALSGRLPFVGTPAQIRDEKRRPAAPIGAGPLERIAVALLDPDEARRPALAEVRGALEGVARGAADAPRVSFVPQTAARPRRLVGREAELSQLLSSTARPGQVTLLEGAAGLGKTTLLDALEGAIGPTLLRTRCYASESIRWNAIDGLVDALAADGAVPLLGDPRDVAALSRLFPSLRASEEAALEAPGADVVRRAARELANVLVRAERTILLVDDAQWADEDSMSLLVELLRAAPRVSLVVAARGPDARSDAIAEVLGAGRPVARLRLAPLTDAEVLELVGAIGEGRGDLAADDLVRATGGVPFLVEEVAWAAQQGRRLAGDGRSLLAARLEAEGEAAAGVLTLLAVHEGPVEVDLLLDEARGADALALRRLVANRLCRIDHAGDRRRLDVYHDAIRRVLLDSLDAAARAAAHGELAARLLALRPERLDDLARHLFGAADLRAPAFARAAADEARRVLAFDRAVTWLRRLLPHARDTSERRELLWNMAECHRLAGRHVDAATDLEALAALEEPARALDLRRCAAEQWLTAGELSRGLAALEALRFDEALTGPVAGRSPAARLLTGRARLRAIGVRGLARAALAPPPRRPELFPRVDLACTVSGCFALIDPARAGAVHAAGLLLALRTGDPERVLRALVGEAIYAGAFGAAGRGRAEALLAAIDEIADGLDDYAQGLARSTRAAVLVQRGDFEGGVRFAGPSLALLREHDKTVGWELMSARHFQLFALYHLGRFDELVRHVQAEWDEASARGNRHRASDVSLHHATVGWLLSHGPSVARQRLEAARRFWAQVGSNVQEYYAVVSDVTIASWEGDAAAAYRALGAGLRGALVPALVVAEGLRSDVLHVVARSALGEFARARSTAAASLTLAAAALLAREPAPHARALARLQLAGLSRALGAAHLSRRLAWRAGVELDRAGLAAFGELGFALAAGRRPDLPAELARALAPGLAPAR